MKTGGDAHNQKATTYTNAIFSATSQCKTKCLAIELYTALFRTAIKTTLQCRLHYLVLVNQRSLNISYITKLSLLAGMLIAKNNKVSSAIREHKSSQKIWE